MSTRRVLAWAMGLGMACALHSVSAQITEPDNNIINTTSYVGCDGASLFPLKVMHNANQPIEFYTDSIGRMHLTESIPAGTINGYTVNQSGHLGIGAFADPAVSNPFTLLHLDWGGDQNTGFRSWMKAGTYITDHSDMMYVGTKPRGGGPNDRNDANNANVRIEPWNEHRLS